MSCIGSAKAANYIGQPLQGIASPRLAQVSFLQQERVGQSRVQLIGEASVNANTSVTFAHLRQSLDRSQLLGIGRRVFGERLSGINVQEAICSVARHHLTWLTETRSQSRGATKGHTRTMHSACTR